jgi:hypothetical protein
VLDAGRVVEEVPRPERAFLAVDEQPTLPREHEEGLLLRLRVIEAVRLPRREHADVDAELRERVVAALEPAPRAERRRRPPLRVPYVHDEPAVGGECEA